ncbi:OmpH family outer membrane protein [Olleya sp. HaHaR_3_96]|uniref:OmpH family outer membrane protein n=1 Tax=Olleya sp. HaHaR_3_96 TaxID=2745560 RepID=UPI001C4F8309|nr:OmpH family outer membrane protein [Olleya sp. HaHaR_3_96]QXP60162.1 OmpH family outer membrane protein [Olleya sp. HaHaR_3_96]
MKLKVLIVLVMLSAGFTASAQRGVRIGYIDTEYILENIPEYTEATGQLDSKVQKWKTEIERKLNDVKLKRESLNNEKALLTKELIEEREEDLVFEEKEILDYQQKRFGPNGDLMIQKRQLMQPVQDQIFQAVQDIAKAKKYDFVFDKSADVVMLYSAERFDMSELIIRTISRASKRTQAKNKSERKNAKEEDVVVEINEDKESRQKAIDDKLSERATAAELRKKEILEAREAKKKEAADKRAKILEDRAKAREDKLNEREDDQEGQEKSISVDEESKVDEGNTPKTREEILEERRLKKLADREARQVELAAKKQKILDDRKKAKEESESTEDEEN